MSFGRRGLHLTQWLTVCVDVYINNSASYVFLPQKSKDVYRNTLDKIIKDSFLVRKIK